MFVKVLNMLLNRVPKLRMFYFYLNLTINSKVTDNPLTKTKKKEPAELSKQLNKNVVQHNYFINFRTLRCTVKRQLISLKYFKIHTQIYISRTGAESCFCTPYTCLVLEQRHIQNPFKHLRWSFFFRFQLMTLRFNCLCKSTPSQMIKGILSTLVFRLHLVMFCDIITNI